jgi:hypothetical protein
MCIDLAKADPLLPQEDLMTRSALPADPADAACAACRDVNRRHSRYRAATGVPPLGRRRPVRALYRSAPAPLGETGAGYRRPVRADGPDAYGHAMGGNLVRCWRRSQVARKVRHDGRDGRGLPRRAAPPMRAAVTRCGQGRVAAERQR